MRAADSSSVNARIPSVNRRLPSGGRAILDPLHARPRRRQPDPSGRRSLAPLLPVLGALLSDLCGREPDAREGDVLRAGGDRQRGRPRSRGLALLRAKPVAALGARVLLREAPRRRIGLRDRVDPGDVRGRRGAGRKAGARPLAPGHHFARHRLAVPDGRVALRSHRRRVVRDPDPPAREREREPRPSPRDWRRCAAG